MKKCPKCSKPVDPGTWLCVCGHEFSRGDAGSESTPSDLRAAQESLKLKLRAAQEGRKLKERRGAYGLVGVGYILLVIALVIAGMVIFRHDRPEPSLDEKLLALREKYENDVVMHDVLSRIDAEQRQSPINTPSPSNPVWISPSRDSTLGQRRSDNDRLALSLSSPSAPTGTSAFFKPAAEDMEINDLQALDGTDLAGTYHLTSESIKYLQSIGVSHAHASIKLDWDSLTGGTYMLTAIPLMEPYSFGQPPKTRDFTGHWTVLPLGVSGRKIYLHEAPQVRIIVKEGEGPRQIEVFAVANSSWFDRSRIGVSLPPIPSLVFQR
jgi:hypothetical protein